MDEKTVDYEVVEPEFVDCDMIEDSEEDTCSGIPTAVKVVAGGVIAAGAAVAAGLVAKKKGLVKKAKDRIKNGKPSVTVPSEVATATEILNDKNTDEVKNEQ